MIRSARESSRLSLMVKPGGGDMMEAPRRTLKAVASATAGSSNRPWGRTKAMRKTRGLRPRKKASPAKKPTSNMGLSKSSKGTAPKETGVATTPRPSTRRLCTKMLRTSRLGRTGLTDISVEKSVLSNPWKSMRPAGSGYLRANPQPRAREATMTTVTMRMGVL